MILAGDVGGTKTLLGLFEPGGRRPRVVDVRTYQSSAVAGAGIIVKEFMSHQSETHGRVRSASFGVAGPVVGGRAQLTNVSWAVDGAELASILGIERVDLLNDLEAMAHSVTVLEGDELHFLQAGEAIETGNAALIAAGTGLGEALLHNVAGRLIPSASEGGHADFAARTNREASLAAEITRNHGRARYEDVISGQGLLNIHGFTHGGTRCTAVPEPHDIRQTPPLISQSAMEARCAHCVEALSLFVSAYGAEAGNLALRAVATRGVWVGGGIAPAILPALRDGRFMSAFLAKAPLERLVARIPVAVILNAQAGLLGAAVHAASSL